MNSVFSFLSVTPALASLDIARSVSFFESKLGFTKIYSTQCEYGIVRRGCVSIHFWACNDRAISEATSCRIEVTGIQNLYQHCIAEEIVHPNAHLAEKPWGSKEFAILDPDGNLVTFYEETEA